ncbi:Endoribonuclease MazF [bioreactor metagenome]|uniref:Endoribonuclease MazF n=1 Tax=bioreactor metagenome TaxID=1076179 RepID=A0A645GI05_9ZZZZ
MLVISNDINNRYSPIVTVIPFTGSVKRLDMPTHVRINPGDVCDGYKPSVIFRSMLLAEQVTAIDKFKLLGYCGIINDPDLMRRIETALMAQVGLGQPAVSSSVTPKANN